MIEIILSILAVVCTLAAIVFWLLPAVGIWFEPKIIERGQEQRQGRGIGMLVKCPVEDVSSCLLYDDGHLECHSCGISGNAEELYVAAEAK